MVTNFLLVLSTELIFVTQWLVAQPGGLTLDFALHLVFVTYEL